MDPSNRYLALTDPCRGDVYVFDTVSWKVSTSLRLWPYAGALHVRWLNSTHLIISNPGRLWMGSTWGENTSSLSDGLVLVRLSADSTLSITGSVSSGHVNGTESLTLLPSSIHSVMLGGFRSNTMDVVDLNTLSITAERTDETWRQMVGVWDSSRDLALLGLWTDEGGLIALDKDLNELGRVVGLPYVFSLCYNYAHTHSKTHTHTHIQVRESCQNISKSILRGSTTGNVSWWWFCDCERHECS